MKAAKVMLVGAVLAMSASAAVAGTKIMATAPAAQYYPVFGLSMKCNILNMNTTAKDVSIEALDYAGIVTDAQYSITLAPQTGASLTTNPSGVAAWCRFTVDGSTKKYRAVAVYDDGNVYTTSQIAK